MENAKLRVYPVATNETLTHRELIQRGGGPTKIGESLDPPVDGNTVKGWARNDSIPGPYWQSFADSQLASLEELAAAATAKRRAGGPDNTQQAPQ